MLSDKSKDLKDTSIDPIEKIKEECEERAKSAPPGSAVEITNTHNAMVLSYYQNVRGQAQKSFYSALIIATIGSGFFIVAIVLAAMHGKYSDIAKFGVISGALTQVISGINFYLYLRTSQQFGTFHICLERVHRYLLANTLSDSIACPNLKDATRAELVKAIMNAPMLDPAGMAKREGTAEGGKASANLPTAAKPAAGALGATAM